MSPIAQFHHRSWHNLLATEAALGSRPLSSGTVITRMPGMPAIDPATERAVRVFLDRIPPHLKVERAILFGSRARGDHRPDSDADLALILERGHEWSVVEELAGLAFDVLMDTGVLIQAVPISAQDWAHPERFARPDFLRNVAKEGIAL
jgi:predicted nucleotidyltransferase